MRKDRRSTIAQQIQHSGVLRHKDFEFLDALYWKQIEEKGIPDDFAAYQHWENTNENRAFWNRPLSSAEIGCAISHFKAWEIVAEGPGNVLVLEDDAVFSDDFDARLSSVEQELGDIEFDLLYLGRHDWKNEPVEFTENVCKPSYSEEAHAYAISPTFARRLLDDSYKRNLVPVDTYLALTYADFYFNSSKPFDRSIFIVRSDEVYAIEPSIVSQQRSVDKSDSGAFSDLIDCVNNVWGMWHPINRN